MESEVPTLKRLPELTRREMMVIVALCGALICGVAAGYLMDWLRRREVRLIPASEEKLYKVDINSAGEAELMLLPGIGKVRAQRIVENRRMHGPFPSVEALARVPGISEALARSLAEFVVARPMGQEEPRD